MLPSSMDVLSDDEVMSADNRVVHFPYGHADRISSIPTAQPIQEVFKGTLWIKNRIKKKWKEKFFVLYNNRILSYWQNQYDFQYNNDPIATIDLALTQSIERDINDGTKSKSERFDGDGDRDRDMMMMERDSSISKNGSVDFAAIFSNKALRSGKPFTSPQSNGEQKEEEKAEMLSPTTTDGGSGGADGDGADDGDGGGKGGRRPRKQRIEYTFKLIMAKRSFSFCVIDDDAYFKTWLVNLELCIFGNVVIDGYLFQLSERKKSRADKKPKWVKRWFVIYSRKEMRYYDDETRRKPKGMVILSNLKCVSKSEDHKAKKKYGQLLFLIRCEFVSEKVVTLGCLSEKERDVWFERICGAYPLNGHGHGLRAAMTNAIAIAKNNNAQIQDKAKNSNCEDDDGDGDGGTNGNARNGRKGRGNDHAKTIQNGHGDRDKRRKNNTTASSLSSTNTSPQNGRGGKKTSRRHKNGSKSRKNIQSQWEMETAEEEEEQQQQQQQQLAEIVVDSDRHMQQQQPQNMITVTEDENGGVPLPVNGSNPLRLRKLSQSSLSMKGSRSRSALLMQPGMIGITKSMKYEFTNSLRSPPPPPPRRTQSQTQTQPQTSTGNGMHMKLRGNSSSKNVVECLSRGSSGGLSAVTSLAGSDGPAYYTSASEMGTELDFPTNTKSSDLSVLMTEIANLKDEILCLKIQTAMHARTNQIDAEIDEQDVEDALLDSDQYLILDKDWQNWRFPEIVEWICSLEYGRFSKYKVALFVNMRHRNLTGKYLCKMQKSDLSTFFGIVDFADITDLYRQIQILTAGSAET